MNLPNSIERLRNVVRRQHKSLSTEASYATCSMANGVSPRAIQLAMGHRSLETTMGYLHAESLSVESPLESGLGGNGR